MKLTERWQNVISGWLPFKNVNTVLKAGEIIHDFSHNQVLYQRRTNQSTRSFVLLEASRSVEHLVRNEQKRYMNLNTIRRLPQLYDSQVLGP